jgi:hypothetical protein
MLGQGVWPCAEPELLHMIRNAAFWGESVRPSMGSIIVRLVKVGQRWSTTLESGISLLRRLFLSAVPIPSFSPDPYPTRTGGNREPSTAGMVGCHGTVKTAPVDLALALLIRIFDDSLGLRVVSRIFSGRICPPNAPQDLLAVKLRHRSGR